MHSYQNFYFIITLITCIDMSDTDTEFTRAKFTYRGKDLKELRKMSMDQFIQLVPSRIRRSLKRGLPKRHKKVLEKLRKAHKASKSKPEPVEVKDVKFVQTRTIPVEPVETEPEPKDIAIPKKAKRKPRVKKVAV